MWRERISFVLVLLLAACLFAGCVSKQAPEEETLWKNTSAKGSLDPWLLVSETLPEGEEAGTYLGNGFYGVRLYSTGFGRLQGRPSESRCYN